ncbi:MAG: PP2C family protein-serine/threonine phosphatase, partial [Acaryochloris sp. SU_5_25]|nr:PP2C family protein-serine/threonine phosphatase [Acaryochloris sp. SU_5_25]
RGRLYLFSSDSGYEWTETRQKLAQLVADQTAVAIENDALTTQLRKQERVTRELEIGAEIQARLLPNYSPNIEGVALAAACKTANQVGGDYYDFIPIYRQLPSPRQYRLNQADRWGLVIGDVMGKGVPAGLIMTMTRGILRADALHHHSPAQILQNLNQVMYADLENSNRFVTLFYSEYDPKTRQLCFSNAAHNPPLLWRAHQDVIERLDTDGMLIGLDANTQYQEDQVSLAPGDTIIYYTDGFTDAANGNGDRFDEENLMTVFQDACHTCSGPQAILDRLFEQLQAFMGEYRHHNDDITLIVMQIQPMLLAF